MPEISSISAGDSPNLGKVQAPGSGGDEGSIIGYIAGLLIEIITFIVIALAPAYPYIKQYMIIKVKRDVGAFSSFVCAIVLYGQAFRILFWYEPQLTQVSKKVLGLYAHSVFCHDRCSCNHRSIYLGFLTTCLC